jgi:hypothetical protein
VALAEARRPHASLATIAADVTVGSLLLLSAAVSPVPPAQRVLVGAAGAAWAAASLIAVPWLHRGARVLALLAFPTGRLSSARRRLLAVPPF